MLYTMTCLNEFLTAFKTRPRRLEPARQHTRVRHLRYRLGKTHSKVEWPVIFAGKANGKLKGDQHSNFPSDNLSKALLTVAQIMGSKLTTLGLDGGNDAPSRASK